MFEDGYRPNPEDVEPGVVLPALDEGRGDDTGGLPAATQPASPANAGRRLRARTKVAGAVAAAVALAVGILVPLELGSALTVSGAVSSVFAQPDVRFVVTESATPRLPGYAVALTISNPSGGAVSAPGAKDSYEFSVLHRGADLGDVMVTHTAIYFRLGTAAIDQLIAANGSNRSLVRTLDRIARKHPELAWLGQVAAGDWLGFRLSQLEPYLKRTLKEVGPPASKLEHEATVMRSAFTMSFAEAWDAWTSLHVASTSGSTTEYELRLPVRDFLLNFARDFESHIEASLPQLDRSFPAMNRALGRIPTKLALPIDLWISNGSLSKVAVSYHGITVDVGISHPGPLPSSPANVTYLTVRQLKVFGRYLTSRSGVTPRSSNEIATQANLQTALIAAMTYYARNGRSFTGLTRTGPNSVQSFDPALVWLPTRRPSTAPVEISSLVSSDGAEVLLVADSRGSNSCFGILDAQRVSGRPLLGVAAPGTYFFVLHRAPAGACDASTITSVKHLSTSGFPASASMGGSSQLLPFGLGSISAGSGANSSISGMAGLSGTSKGSVSSTVSSVSS